MITAALWSWLSRCFRTVGKDANKANLDVADHHAHTRSQTLKRRAQVRCELLAQDRLRIVLTAKRGLVPSHRAMSQESMDVGYDHRSLASC
jgi:hypothetical protein